MEFTLLLILMFVALAMILLILVQRNEGGGLGMGGGQQNNMLNLRGSGNALTRMTAILAAIFMGLSLFLAATTAQEGAGTDSLFADEDEVQEDSFPAPNLDDMPGISDMVEEPDIEEANEEQAPAAPDQSGVEDDVNRDNRP